MRLDWIKNDSFLLEDQNTKQTLNQYDVVLVNLDPTVGSEIKKTRPCVVISPDELNRHIRTIVVAPMTSTLKDYPTRVKVKFSKKEGRIAVDQIRSIDRKRIVQNLGCIKPAEVKRLKSVIFETYVA